MLNDLSELEGSGRSGEGVNGSAALALRYNDPVLETLALQRLKELAPLVRRQISLRHVLSVCCRHRDAFKGA